MTAKKEDAPKTRMIVEAFKTKGGLDIRLNRTRTFDVSRLADSGIVYVFSGVGPEDDAPDLRRFEMFRDVVYATGSQVLVDGNRGDV